MFRGLKFNFFPSSFIASTLLVDCVDVGSCSNWKRFNPLAGVNLMLNVGDPFGDSFAGLASLFLMPNVKSLKRFFVFGADDFASLLFMSFMLEKVKSGKLKGGISFLESALPAAAVVAVVGEVSLGWTLVLPKPGHGDGLGGSKLVADAGTAGLAASSVLASFLSNEKSPKLKLVAGLAKSCQN
ncbi:hypothetical protein M9Y10_041091 [Tritrichomonas musculus]|uniref:Uncharacterized protein n=1 Tax=Tritrichomonas musculus TaxID=1915356 RepID=A0ABR2K3E9_9EUKA